jgi:hypothetical protein
MEAKVRERWITRGIAAGAAVVAALAMPAMLACGGDDSPVTPSPRPSGGAAGIGPGGVAARPVPAVGDVLGTSKAPAREPPGARTDYDVPPFASLAARFAYDRGAPLDFEIHGETRDVRVTVFDVTYTGAGHAVRAWLVLPVVQRRVPAVLFAHGYGSTRDEFLGQAQNKLGPRGVAALLVDTQQNLWSFDAESNARAWRSLVIDLRRGLDLLESLPQVDAGRLGFVGSRQGADAGAVMAGVEARVKAFALISCAAYLNRASQFDAPGVARLQGDALDRFLAEMFAYSPVHYVRHSHGAAFLLMSSRSDRDYPIPYVRAMLAAMPEPKRLRWHAAARYLDPASYEFQSRWLLRRL